MGASRIIYENVDEVLENILRRDKFNIKFMFESLQITVQR